MNENQLHAEGLAELEKLAEEIGREGQLRKPYRVRISSETFYRFGRRQLQDRFPEVLVGRRGGGFFIARVRRGAR